MAMLGSIPMVGAQAYQERIATVHDHLGLDIKPEYYSLWLESLIQTVSEFDPYFDDDIEQVWRQFLQPAIDFMISHY